LSVSQHSLMSSFSQRQHAHHLVVLGLNAVRLLPRPSCGLIDLRRDNSQVRAEIAEGLGGQRTDRTQVDDVAGEFGIDGLADEGHDLRVRSPR
jgi:hypothetical protein